MSPHSASDNTRARSMIFFLSVDRFYAALAFNLKCRFKIVHAAAAEVIGMAMKQKAEIDKVRDDNLT